MTTYVVDRLIKHPDLRLSTQANLTQHEEERLLLMNTVDGGVPLDDAFPPFRVKMHMRSGNICLALGHRRLTEFCSQLHSTASTLMNVSITADLTEPTIPGDKNGSVERSALPSL